MAERGSLSINSENMFPIIKKWLYSDHDIFYRELISNGCDAITKLKKLDMMGDYALPEDYKARIDIVVSPADKTITVSDNGIGIPESDLPYIFDRFYRVDKSRNREAGGSGLGLSIVKSTVEMRGGTVNAQNRENGGMIFNVVFPLYSAEK